MNIPDKYAFWRWPAKIRQLSSDLDRLKAEHAKAVAGQSALLEWVKVTHRLGSPAEGIRSMLQNGKRIIPLLFLLVCQSVLAQPAPPILRQPLTTNSHFGPTPTEGQVPIWNATANKWSNNVPSGGGIGFSALVWTNDNGTLKPIAFPTNILFRVVVPDDGIGTNFHFDARTFRTNGTSKLFQIYNGGSNALTIGQNGQLMAGRGNAIPLPGAAFYGIFDTALGETNQQEILLMSQRSSVGYNGAADLIVDTNYGAIILVANKEGGTKFTRFSVQAGAGIDPENFNSFTMQALVDGATYMQMDPNFTLLTPTNYLFSSSVRITNIHTLLSLQNSNTPVLEVDGVGDLRMIKRIPYLWPSAQGAAGTALTNNGSGALGWWPITVSAGGSLTTNANQFLGVPLSIKDEVFLTNVNVETSLQVSNGHAYFSGPVTNLTQLNLPHLTVSRSAIINAQGDVTNSSADSNWSLYSTNVWNSRQGGSLVLTNLSGTGAITNLFTPSLSNSSIKPIVFGGVGNAAGMTNITGQLYGLEAGANISITPNGSNLVLSATSSGGGDSLWTNEATFVRLIGGSTNSLKVMTNGLQGIAIGDTNALGDFWGWPYDGLTFISLLDGSSGHNLNQMVFGVDSRVGNAYSDVTANSGASPSFTSVSQVNTNDVAAYLIGSDIRKEGSFFSLHDLLYDNQVSLKVGGNTSAEIGISNLIRARWNGLERFIIQTNGHLTLAGVTYAPPTAQGASQTVLTNDGAGRLGWGSVVGDFQPANANLTNWALYSTNVVDGKIDKLNGIGTNLSATYFTGTTNAPFRVNDTNGPALVNVSTNGTLSIKGSTRYINIGESSVAGFVGFAVDTSIHPPGFLDAGFFSDGGNMVLNYPPGAGLYFTENTANKVTIGRGGTDGFVGIGTASETPSALLSVGSGSKFQVDATGDVRTHGLMVLTNIPGQNEASLRIAQTNGLGYSEFTVTNSVIATNRFVFSVGSNTVSAGHVFKVHSTSISAGINTIVLTNDTDSTGGGGLATNANQFGANVTLSIKEGALLTNTLFYPSNLTAPATIELASVGSMTNLTEWRQTNGAVALAISSNGLYTVAVPLLLANAVSFRTNNVDFKQAQWQTFSASLKTNLVLQLTNCNDGVTHTLSAFGSGRLGGGTTNAWQLLCTVAAGNTIYWPPGTTNGNYDVLVNSNQVVTFTFRQVFNTNIFASYLVGEAGGAN